MGPASQVTATERERPAEGEAQEILGFQRVLFWLRLSGLAVLLIQVPGYEIQWPWIIVGVVALTGSTAIAQRLTLRADMPISVLRHRARLFLASDMIAVYAVGTAFTADPNWLGFYYYPLMSLEATLVAGTTAGLAVTGLSLLVYGAQVALHVALGNPVATQEVVAALSLIGMTGGFTSVVGLLTERGRRDLRIMLALAAALAHQRDEAETIELLDSQLHDAVGGRVRSIALRDGDGRFGVVRWRTPERQPLDVHDLQALGDVEQLEAKLSAGVSLTYQTDAWSVVTSALHLPEWARAVTLVPIFLEDGWIGIMPVIWPVSKSPTRHELRLLYGLANQVGLALAQGQLQRVREEAATDSLTRLRNRRAINDELVAFVARAERSMGRFAILFCDLDGFKAVNDRHGHEAGDRVLRDVAAAVSGAVRAGDVVGRYGGDELLIVAGDVDTGTAVALAERVGAAVRSAAAREDVDMTIGIARYPDDGATDTDLMVAADKAMYRGKLHGRGHVVVAGDAEPRTGVPAG